MIGRLRNFTAKEDREAGTEFAPCSALKRSPVAACGFGSITGFSFNLLHRVCVPVYHGLRPTTPDKFVLKRCDPGVMSCTKPMKARKTTKMNSSFVLVGHSARF